MYSVLGNRLELSAPHGLGLGRLSVVSKGHGTQAYLSLSFAKPSVRLDHVATSLGQRTEGRGRQFKGILSYDR